MEYVTEFSTKSSTHPLIIQPTFFNLFLSFVSKKKKGMHLYWKGKNEII